MEIFGDGDSAILQVQGLRIAKRDVVLVRNAAFSVPPNSVVGVAGESGSGKTLTCRALSGLLPSGITAMAGELEFEGCPASRKPCGWPSLRGKVVTIFQEPRLAFNPVRSISSQFSLVLLASGVTDKARRQALMTRYLEHVQIAQATRVLGSFPSELSGGMLQRVLVAMVLARKPRLIVADEPTSSLDAVVRRRVVDLILETKIETGAALLLVTHDLSLLLRVCEHIHIMRQGEIVEAGPTAAVRESPQHPYTQLLLRGVRSTPLRASTALGTADHAR